MRSLVPLLLGLLSTGCLLKQASCSQQAGDDDLRGQWYSFSHNIDDVIWPLKQRFISLLNQVTSSNSMKFSDNCRRSLTDFSTGLSSGSRESHMLFDSFTKTHPGILGERMFDFGAYEQCLNLQFYSSHARYIILHLSLPVYNSSKLFKYHDDRDSWIAEMSRKISAIRTANYPIALCLPSPCTDADIEAIISSDIVKRVTSPASLRLDSSESLSEAVTPDRVWLQLISRALLSIIIGTVSVSTLVNYFNPAYGFLKPFDAVSNTNKLFADSRQENKNLSFLNGFRALYLLLNIPSHIAIPHVETNFFYNFIIFRNSRTFSSTNKMYVMTAGHYVSSNVLIAACLSTIGWLPELSKEGSRRESSRSSQSDHNNNNNRAAIPTGSSSNSSIGFLSYIILRALRTLPVMIAFMLITFTFPIIGPGGGPLMKRMQKTLSNKCFTHGWKDLLFVSNFGTFHEMCMPVGWFMSADFQLYVIAFVYLKLLNTRPRIGFSLIGIQVLAGILVHALYMRHVDVPAILKLWTWDGYNNLHNYIKLFAHTFNYIAIYPVGVILGYFMVKGYKIQVKNQSLFFLLLVIASQAALQFTPALLYDQDEFKYFGRTGEIIFGSLHRLVFVVIYAIALLFLHSNPDFWISRLLSHKLLVVVSRFSYSAFMAHPLVIMFMLSSLPDLHLSSTLLFMMCLYTTVVSLLVGYLFFIFFEAPAMNLLKSWASGSKIRSISMMEERPGEASNKHHHKHQ